MIECVYVVKLGSSECGVAGMKDLGLYRVSGVLSDIQKLKKVFEKGVLNLIDKFKMLYLSISPEDAL